MKTKRPPSTKEVRDLIFELAANYVNKPAEITAGFQESTDGAVYFALNGHSDDDARLIGRGGAHADALSFIVEQIGAATGRTFTFRLITGDGQATPWDRPNNIVQYDPRPARDLLCRFLAAFGFEDFSVEVNPGTGARNSLSFNFDVRVAKAEDSYRLTLVHTATLSNKKIVSLSIVGAFGTLYRAIARQAGVNFQLNVLKP